MADKTALITGGSRGIGLAIAEAFVRDGISVILVARNQEELERARSGISGSVEIAILDVSDHVAVAACVNKLPTLDILINAAGVIEPIGPIESVDPSAWKRLFEINVFGVFTMTQACMPLLAKRGGTIVNFVGGGEGAFPNFSAYAASKGAVARFTETAAAELKDTNITVNAIAPGAVNTKMTEDMIAAGADAGPQFERAMKQKENLEATPDKAVKLVSWLCSDAARGITGRIISAQWDNFEAFPVRLADMEKSDVYTMRRVQPKDRGFDWE